MAKRVALLTNYIPPYRLPLYQAVAALVDEFRVFLSVPMEPHRPWNPNWQGLNVTLQKTWTLKRTWRHPHGFADTVYVHVPYDTLWVLGEYQPDVVISAEMGLRTLQAVLYRKFHPKSRLILWALYSEASEQGRGKLRDRLREWIAPQADAVIVNGQSGARYIHRFGIPDEKIFFAPYTTDISLFTALSLTKSPEQSHRLLYVGQLVERKGLLPFMTILGQWCETHRDRAVELWLVGDGSQRATLEQIMFPPNLAVKFCGSVDYGELPNLYAQGGILVFPSLADEWGLVVNEAMGAGLPVLGSVYSQAVEELIVDGVTGWRFRPDQNEEMYAALDRALNTSADALALMRQTARDRIQHLTPEFIAEQLFQGIQFVSEVSISAK